jgi:hypothetical protein
VFGGATFQSVLLADYNPLAQRALLEAGYLKDGRQVKHTQLLLTLLKNLQKGPIQTSVSIRNNQLQGSLAWMSSMHKISGFLNMVLAPTHPDLYSAVVKGLQALRQQGGDKNLSKLWSSVFTGINVISNRRTIAHYDRFGHLQWYDLLVGVGTYTRAYLVLPDLGAKLVYDPGTVVLLCGKLLRHEIPFWGRGDRVCWAHFMREAVLNGLGVLVEKVPVGWSTRDKIRGILGI